MKRLSLFFTFFLLLSIHLTGQKNIRLKVLTFNIYHGETMNHDFDLSKIAQIINNVKPDLVALQEVDLRTKRAKKMDLVTELAQLTGMNPLFGRAMYFDDGEYGEGILSKYSFIKTQRHLLPYSKGHEPRAALEILIELPEGDTICFVATHLDHTKNPADRINQVKEINNIFSNNKYLTILAGDLNATPESETIKTLKNFWTDACSLNDAKTFPSDNPDRRIDYIMYKPANKWKLIEYKVICNKIASDHCAVLSVLEIIK